MFTAKNFISLVFGDNTKGTEEIYKEFEDIYFKQISKKLVYEKKNEKKNNVISELFKSMGINVDEMLDTDDTEEDNDNILNFFGKNEDKDGMSIKDLEKIDMEEEMNNNHSCASEAIYGTIIDSIINTIYDGDKEVKISNKIGMIITITTIYKVIFHTCLNISNISIAITNISKYDSFHNDIKNLEDRIRFGISADVLNIDDENDDIYKKSVTNYQRFIVGDNEDRYMNLHNLVNLFNYINPVNIGSNDAIEMFLKAYDEYAPIIENEDIFMLNSRWYYFVVDCCADFINIHNKAFVDHASEIIPNFNLKTFLTMIIKMISTVCTTYGSCFFID